MGCTQSIRNSADCISFSYELKTLAWTNDARKSSAASAAFCYYGLFGDATLCRPAGPENVTVRTSQVYNAASHECKQPFAQAYTIAQFKAMRNVWRNYGVRLDSRSKCRRCRNDALRGVLITCHDPEHRANIVSWHNMVRRIRLALVEEAKRQMSMPDGDHVSSMIAASWC